jgi:hypothetical protein
MTPKNHPRRSPPPLSLKVRMLMPAFRVSWRLPVLPHPMLMRLVVLVKDVVV